MQKVLSLPPEQLKQWQLHSGMNLSQIMVSQRNSWQTKAITLNPSLSKNCANCPIFERCKQHHITQRLMTSVRFNQNLVSMIGTLEAKDKQYWKYYIPTLLHVYNSTTHNARDFSPYYLMYRWKLSLPIDIKFVIASPQAEECSHNKFRAKLSAQLRWCYELANLYQCKEATHHKLWYDQKMKASNLEPGGSLPGKTKSIWG